MTNTTNEICKTVGYKREKCGRKYTVRPDTKVKNIPVKKVYTVKRKLSNVT
jgi:hypothetical protein